MIEAYTIVHVLCAVIVWMTAVRVEKEEGANWMSVVYILICILVAPIFVISSVISLLSKKI